MRHYWLFKSEPDAYGIADLERATNKTVRWDGIRNYQARNFLRDTVKQNDWVFFYHSSCKQPGIVGTAQVVSDSYPDPEQFNPESPYYDAKASTDKPVWYSVDIQHLETFAQALTPSKLRQLPELENMALFKQARLSVQPVTAAEWEVISALA